MPTKMIKCWNLKLLCWKALEIVALFSYMISEIHIQKNTHTEKDESGGHYVVIVNDLHYIIIWIL